MSEAEIIHDAEVIGTELEPTTHGNLFRTEDPVEIIRRASETADALAAVVRRQNLVSTISGREHVKVEGWTLLGTMLGVFPVTVWSRRTEHEEGWEARVEARTLAGQVVGAAESECTRSEKMWSHDPGTNKYGKPIEPRDDYALRSMAQTRATSKALRQPLGFVMQLAGFDPTPAEEMPRDVGAQQNRVEGPPPLKPPTSWAKITEMVGAYDAQVNGWYSQFADAARRLLFPESEPSMKGSPKPDKDHWFRVCAGAAVHLREQFEPDELPPPGLEDLRACFARVLDGQELAIPEEQLDDEAAEAAARD